MFSGQSTAGSLPSLEELTEFPAGAVSTRIAATCAALSDVGGVFVVILVDKRAPTLRVYFRNFIRIFWYFNRLFRLNFLYFRRNTALSIESGRTAFITSPP